MDNLTPEQRSRNMSLIKGKDTRPEKIVRSVLHRMGYRFRLHINKLPGKPDIFLPKYKSVIFVHGCFWHGHEGCKRAKVPTTRTEFWENKINKNKNRDESNLASLVALGYRCLVIWQCEIQPVEMLKERLYLFLGRK